MAREWVLLKSLGDVSPQIRPFVLNKVEGLAIAGEAGVVQHLGDLQHHLSELVHGDDHHPFVGGLDPRLLQVLEKGIEVLGDKEVPPFQVTGGTGRRGRRLGSIWGAGIKSPWDGRRKRAYLPRPWGSAKWSSASSL